MLNKALEKTIVGALNMLLPKLLSKVNENLKKQSQAKTIILVFEVGDSNFENCKIRIVKKDSSFTEKPFDVSDVNFENLVNQKS